MASPRKLSSKTSDYSVSNGVRIISPESKNPALRKVAKRVLISDIKSRRIKNLIKEMKELLAKEEFGVALAAPQVKEPLRLFIVSGRALARGSRSAGVDPF